MFIAMLWNHDQTTKKNNNIKTPLTKHTYGLIWKYGIPSGNLLQFAIENGTCIVDLPTKDGDFPVRYVSLPKGKKFLYHWHPLNSYIINIHY